MVDSKPQSDKLDELEKSQTALRASIEASKRLTQESQGLLDQHRQQTKTGDD